LLESKKISDHLLPVTLLEILVLFCWTPWISSTNYQPYPYQWAVLHVVIRSHLLILILELMYAQILFLFG